MVVLQKWSGRSLNVVHASTNSLRFPLDPYILTLYPPLTLESAAQCQSSERSGRHSMTTSFRRQRFPSRQRLPTPVKTDKPRPIVPSRPSGPQFLVVAAFSLSSTPLSVNGSRR